MPDLKISQLPLLSLGLQPNAEIPISQSGVTYKVTASGLSALVFGGSGLSTVTTDATLTGDGTIGNPLSITNPLPAAGSNGQVLTIVAGAPTWSSGSGANIVAYPKQGTFALLGAIEELFFVLAIDEWEEFLITDNAALECRVSGGRMLFNQAENNSDLLILPRLLQELDKVANFMEALKSSLSSAVPVPGDGGLAIKTVVSAALSATQPLMVANMGNNKIRH